MIGVVTCPNQEDRRSSVPEGSTTGSLRALLYQTGFPKTAHSKPVSETWLSAILSSPISMAAIASCGMIKEMREVMRPVTLRTRASILAPITLTLRTSCSPARCRHKPTAREAHCQESAAPCRAYLRVI
jgi:hypothetical protein